MDVSLDRYVNCLYVVLGEKPAAFVTNSLLIQ
jgi:hypothetical protein